MKQSKIHIEDAARPVSGFRTAVSLHSHTLHSRETLAFIGSLAEKSSLCRTALNRGKRQYRERKGIDLDLNRGWWTPPLAPFDAWTLERKQIEDRLNLKALISLTDHDDIEAPLSLRVLDPCQNLPISVEWTVPYGPTFFHLGVHNIVPERARSIMKELESFTATRRTVDLEGILQSLSSNPETLVIFNHPCWDENVIGQEAHIEWATQFLRHYSDHIHALELNGLRPWSENRRVMQVAYEFGKPLISGGDRHALEPNTTLDLTNAATFSEFVEQVRSGWTDVLITSQYSEPFTLRIIQSLQEVLAYREDHGRGWKSWSDRVFYQCDDGVVRSMTTLFPSGFPGPIRVFISGVGLTRHRRFRQTFRFAFARRQEVAL